MKRHIPPAWFCIALAFWAAARGAAGEPETREQYDARMTWFRDARFGMFIHWGPVSLKGTEIGWSRGDGVALDEYDNLYKQFNPVKFNADEWVKVARDAGMKYIVLTSKHHDGFCLWDTKTTDYNVMHSPFGRDVVKELAEACKRQGIVYCSYFSILDWRDPLYPLGAKANGTATRPDMDAFGQRIKEQVAEQLTNYGPLGILWFDGEWEAPWTHERGADLYRHVRALQPSLIVNNRVDKGRGDHGTTKPGFLGDYDTPEQQIGNFSTARPWETCMTIGSQWAWKPNDAMKSLKECLQTLIRTAGGDGNLLFNVGPMPSGEIEPRQVARLREMGAWLARGGESIYGTRGGPFKPGPYGVSTRKGKTIYVHVMQWTGDTVTLPALPARIIGNSVLTGGSATIAQADTGIQISVPAANRQEIDTIIALELDRAALEIEAR